MLILDDILPQNHALKELQKVLNSHTNPVETFKSIETFDKIDVAQRRLEFLYSNGYIRGATPTLPQVNLTSAPKK